MKSKTIAFLTALLLIIVLTGCNNAPPNEDKTQPFSFSESNQSTPESEAPAVNESKEVETTPETLQESEPDKQKETMEKDTVSSEQPQTDSDNRQTVQPAELPNEADKTDNPISTPQPSVPKQTESKVPEPPKTEEAPSETKPDFDIDYWISFAKDYAESVGLQLDSETYLYITVSHKTADEMAAQYGFNEEQKEYLTELLADENNSLWSQVLYGITGTDDQIVTVALSQIGTMGGDPYWSWYGFNSRVEWCACFVSWCANECGYIDAGVIPKYAGCVNGVQWFKDRGQWLDNSAEPTPGMIIFFDWADESGQDGLSDHTGIVQKVENGRVYTVEGNSGDSVRQNSYPVGYYEILGYGAPAY